MARDELETYFAYREGHDPSVMRFGTMVLDYANPRSYRSHFHRETENLLGDPPLATKDERSLCSLSQVGGQSISLDVDLEKFLNASHSRSSTSSRLVVGVEGSQIELLYPEKFFEKQVLEDDAARQWLQKTLTVASQLEASFKNVFSPPKIWLLTGVYLMKDAVSYSVYSKSTTTAASVTVPLLTDMASLQTMRIGTKVELAQALEGKAMSAFVGTKVFAAQWRLISADYVTSELSSSMGMLKNRLVLLDKWSYASRRQNEERVVQVSLAGKDGSSYQPSEKGYDEDAWRRFDKEMSDLEAELEEE